MYRVPFNNSYHLNLILMRFPEYCYYLVYLRTWIFTIVHMNKSTGRPISTQFLHLFWAFDSGPGPDTVVHSSFVEHSIRNFYAFVNIFFSLCKSSEMVTTNYASINLFEINLIIHLRWRYESIDVSNQFPEPSSTQSISLFSSSVYWNNGTCICKWMNCWLN